MAEACIGCEKPSWYIFHRSLKVIPRWEEIQAWFWAERFLLFSQHLFDLICFYYIFLLHFNLPPSLRRLVVRIDRVDGPIKCDMQEFTGWINWASLQRTRLLIKVMEPLSVQGISLPFHFLFLFPLLQPINPSVNVYPRLGRAHTHARTHAPTLQWHGCGWKQQAINSNLSAVKDPLWCCASITEWLQTQPTHTVTGVKEILSLCGCCSTFTFIHTEMGEQEPGVRYG